MKCTFGVANAPMKRFTLAISEELHQWLTDNMPGHGISTLSAFIRVILVRFKREETNQRWTDADMKDFARTWHRSQLTEDKPYFLQEPELRIREAFEKFKRERA